MKLDNTAILRCAMLLALLSARLAAKADDAEGLLRQAQQAAAQDKHAEAVKLLTQAIQLAPQNADAWYLRGRANFCLGKAAESVADFDRYVQLRPEREKSLWERGISHYYAKKWQEGAKQFELYQTYHDNDVENSVWRYLCMAKVDGVEKAQSQMLPIKNDPRVPMMQIFDLYRGRLKPEDVLAAAKQGQVDARRLHVRLFYAHLYLGLYYEAHGKSELAKLHISKAANDYPIEHYMGDVARVHAQRLK